MRLDRFQWISPPKLIREAKKVYLTLSWFLGNAMYAMWKSLFLTLIRTEFIFDSQTSIRHRFSSSMLTPERLPSPNSNLPPFPCEVAANPHTIYLITFASFKPTLSTLPYPAYILSLNMGFAESGISLVDYLNNVVAHLKFYLEQCLFDFLFRTGKISMLAYSHLHDT